MPVDKPVKQSKIDHSKDGTGWNPSERTLGLILFGPFLLYYFLCQETVGGDDRYFQFLVIFSSCAGVLTIYIWIWSDIVRLVKQKVAGTKELLWKVASLITFFWVGVFVGFLMLAVPVMCVWEMYNCHVTNNSPAQVISCPIDRFYLGSGRNRSCIYFNFGKHHEKIIVQYRNIEQYKDEYPKNYNILITCRKGLLDYYVVDGWDVVKKD